MWVARVPNNGNKLFWIKDVLAHPLGRMGTNGEMVGQCLFSLPVLHDAVLRDLAGLLRLLGLRLQLAELRIQLLQLCFFLLK